MNRSITLKAPYQTVSPAFDGATTLPRVAHWPELSETLRAHPSVHELDPSIFKLGLGLRYARQMTALGLTPTGATVRVEATRKGLTATLLLRAGGRTLEDRWEVEVDTNGLMRQIESDHHTGDWHYNAKEFSLFFDTLIRGVSD